jgi:hypothetical protein
LFTQLQVSQCKLHLAHAGRQELGGNPHEEQCLVLRCHRHTDIDADAVIHVGHFTSLWPRTKWGRHPAKQEQQGQGCLFCGTPLQQQARLFGVDLLDVGKFAGYHDGKSRSGALPELIVNGEPLQPGNQ